METNPEKGRRLLLAVETLVEEECFAATRGDWDDVVAAQRRAAPLLESLNLLLAGDPSSAQLTPRVRRLQRQQAELLAHVGGTKSRVASRLAAVEAAAGRLAGMKRAYARPPGAPAVLRQSA